MNTLLKMDMPTVTVDHSSRIVVMAEVPVSSLRLGDLLVSDDTLSRADADTEFLTVSKVTHETALGGRTRFTLDDQNGKLALVRYDRPTNGIRIVSRVLVITNDGHIVTVHQRPAI